MSKTDYIEQFKVKPGTKVDLDKIDPDYTGEFPTDETGKKRAKVRLKENQERLEELQELMYAEGKHSLLTIFQASDAAGKDGTIKRLTDGMNAQGTIVYPFKKPSEEELKHHYLWRISKAAPSKGHVSIFNRSHYEDVLIVRVRDLYPEEEWSKHYKSREDLWKARFEEIKAFEKTLAQSGTKVLKFYLHIDKEEQLKRFWDRVADPTKNWKLSEYDFSERERWDEYRHAYEEMLSNTSTEESPWFIIPNNHKWFGRFAVTQIVADEMEKMGMELPEPEVDIEEVKKKYFGVEKPGDKPRFDLI